MITNVTKSTVIRPAAETPRHILRYSNLDMVVPPVHTQTIYVYRPTGAANFFDAQVLKEALSKVLVPFYPMAGRLRREDDNRISIDCNSEGVVFTEANTDATLDDFDDFAPTVKMQQLIPTVDESAGIGSFPLQVVQVTYFKCGGVTLGVSIHHSVADGTSALYYMKSWSEIARGSDITIPPFVDRTVVRARDPPRPAFPHVEYLPPPHLKTPLANPHNSAAAIFRFTRNQLDALKKKSKADDDDGATATTTYSSFVTLTAHVWRCACKARDLLDDQETKLYIPADSRFRLHAGVPSGYFGNAIFTTTSQAPAGDVVSKPLWYGCRKIQEVVARMDDEYLMSALDYLEVHPNPTALACDEHTFQCPNLAVVSWIRLPVYDADFGWGRPIYMGPAGLECEGQVYVMPSPTNDGNLFIFVGLHEDHITAFQKYLYEI